MTEQGLGASSSTHAPPTAGADAPAARCATTDTGRPEAVPYRRETPPHLTTVDKKTTSLDKDGRFL